MPRGKRLETEEKELARGLLAMGKSYREVAEALELSVGSVHNIAKEPLERVEPMVSEIKRRFAMKHWLLADHILNKIHIHDVARASLREKALAAAIITDKALMLEKALKATGPSMREESTKTQAGDRAGDEVAGCPEVVEAGLVMNGG
jgi:hypothetical protein